MYRKMYLTNTENVNDLKRPFLLVNAFVRKQYKLFGYSENCFPHQNEWFNRR